VSVDPSILQAIKSAVEAQPEQVALRVHLAELLLQDGQFQACLEQVGMIQIRQPDHKVAIELGFKAASGKGDQLLAASYERLLNSLNMDKARNLIESAGIPSQSLDESPVLSEKLPLAPIRDETVDSGDMASALDFDRPEITLSDVKGLRQVKERLDLAFLGPLRNPELRKLYGKSLKGGLLLYGPPGCGKTFIARAIAGELGAKFFSIGLTDVVDMWLGNSEKNLHEIFQNARRLQPSVLFFDELDALGRKRSLTRDHAGRTIVNQFLNELDSAQYNNEGVFVIGATNHPWDVDSALKRPGRLDRTVLVLPPDAEAREEIAKMVLADRPTSKIDTAWIAKETENFSGADVTYVIECASEFALNDSIRSNTVRPIDMGDIKKALKQVSPSTRAWFESAKNHAIFANEGGAYDDLILYLKQKKMI
jgi:SpoVK/Ycf46/Vps4 family AAA+-type ATPase